MAACFRNGFSLGELDAGLALAELDGRGNHGRNVECVRLLELRSLYLLVSAESFEWAYCLVVRIESTVEARLVLLIVHIVKA